MVASSGPTVFSRADPTKYFWTVSTVEQMPASNERPETRLEFETLISDLSTRFINMPPGEVDEGIEDALRRACE